MSDKSKILDKIKKCMALASSGNEHEAAAALRQAQKLMREHGITDDAVMAAAASEADARAGAFARPSAWETSLAVSVGEAFGCETLFMRHRNPFGGFSSWRYIGCGASPQVAQYAFQVLYRQAKKARADYIKTKLKRVRKTSVRTRRADLFCEGWVSTALLSVASWHKTADQKRAIDAFIQCEYPSAGDLKPTNRNDGRKLTDREFMDYWRGHDAGKNAEVNRGVGTDAAPAMLEG